MGLVINHVAPLTFKELGESQELEVPASREAGALFKGGPVEPYRGFVLHDSAQVEERNEILPGLFLSVSSDSLPALISDPSVHLRFCLGYAGWSPGQIELEMKEGSWLYTEADREIVLHEDPEHAWERTIKSMGIDPGWVVPPGGVN